MNLFPSGSRDRGRQVMWLSVAVALLAAVLWYQQRPAEAPVIPSNSPMTPPPQLAALTLPETVDLGALEGVPERSEEGRNPFGFGVRPAPPAPPPVSFPAPVSVAPPPGPVLPPGPPPITLKFTGMFRIPGGERTMVLLKDPATGTSYQGSEGDIIDGRYRVVKVGLQSVVVSYVDGSGQRTIPLGG